MTQKLSLITFSLWKWYLINDMALSLALALSLLSEIPNSDVIFKTNIANPFLWKATSVNELPSLTLCRQGNGQNRSSRESL